MTPLFMSSLVTNLNSSTAQEIVNWVTSHDCRRVRRTADATQLDIESRRRCVLGMIMPWWADVWLAGLPQGRLHQAVHL